jgi:hypothetical protein
MSESIRRIPRLLAMALLLLAAMALEGGLPDPREAFVDLLSWRMLAHAGRLWAATQGASHA